MIQLNCMSRHKLFDRSKLNVKSAFERDSLIDFSVMINPDSKPAKIGNLEKKLIKELASDMKKAKRNRRSIIFAYGAHLFRNGCSPIIIEMIKQGYITQLLTNGAGVIHDFEMSYMGRTTEDVKKYLDEGQFGIWGETGKYINECLSEGVKNNKGYGEAIGEMIDTEYFKANHLEFPFKGKSILAVAYGLNIPLSVSIGVGHDITNSHPSCDGSAIGRASYTDFLIFVNSVSNLDKGVFISSGSAIMAPMVLEKALSMARNVAHQENKKIDDFKIFVNDIQPGTWDWAKSEPPKNNPAYYCRFAKSFSRMGGRFSYLELDNRDFVHNLYKCLKD